MDQTPKRRTPAEVLELIKQKKSETAGKLANVDKETELKVKKAGIKKNDIDDFNKPAEIPEIKIEASKENAPTAAEEEAGPTDAEIELLEQNHAKLVEQFKELLRMRDALDQELLEAEEAERAETEKTGVDQPQEEAGEPQTPPLTLNSVNESRYTPGQQVTIRRSDNTLESDWRVNPNESRLLNGKKVVMVYKGNFPPKEGTLFKEVFEEDLDTLNQTTKSPSVAPEESPASGTEIPTETEQEVPAGTPSTTLKGKLDKLSAELTERRKEFSQISGLRWMKRNRKKEAINDLKIKQRVLASIQHDRELKPFWYYAAEKITNNPAMLALIKDQIGENEIDLSRASSEDRLKENFNSGKLIRTGTNEGFYRFNVLGFTEVIKNINEITDSKGNIEKDSPKAIYKIVGPDGTIARDNIIGSDQATEVFNQIVSTYRENLEREFNSQKN